MTIRKKVGNCISRYGEIASEKNKVDFEWTIIREEDFNFRVLGFYLTMLQYDDLGEEKLDEIKKCLINEFAKQKKDVYILDYKPELKTQIMPYPYFLQLNYLACVRHRKHYLVCEDFFYLSKLYYKRKKGKELNPDEVAEGKEKCEHFHETEFDKILKAYGSYFTLGGKVELQDLFNGIYNSFTGMKYDGDGDSGPNFHDEA